MKAKQGNRLRIIGGKWRGRKLDIVDAPGLRPTPDRVRETLFNWLQPYIAGARCLDLYAGTGVLGIEAVSRGATSATLVENNSQACRAIRNAISLFAAESVRCVQADVQDYLQSAVDGEKPYHIVFLDPPYRQSLTSSTCRLLLEHQWLRPGALIYLETEAELQELNLPPSLQKVKEKVAGQVAYHLLCFQDNA